MTQSTPPDLWPAIVELEDILERRSLSERIWREEGRVEQADSWKASIDSIRAALVVLYEHGKNAKPV